MPHDESTVRSAVRQQYAGIATNPAQSVGCGPSDCCAPKDFDVVSLSLGYSPGEVSQVPEGANLGLGCGNPQAIASLQPGEVVIDLGSGAGFDCFLAANQVGPTGRVIGIDMTHEMLANARRNAEQGGYQNVEFRLGEIENLPVADNSANVIISNCVINLSPNKRRVLAEAFRVLQPGGRLAISDVVATAEIPEEMRADLHLVSCCISGAEQRTVLESMLKEIGFVDVRITPKDESKQFIRDWAPGRAVEELVVSASIQGRKP